jgi:IPT/TIG domain.
MRLSYIPLALTGLLVIALMLSAQATFPRMTSVDPGTAKAGVEVTVAGENLDKANIAEVYLSDGEKDLKVQVTDQTATAVKFKVPDGMKPGRFSLVVLTATKPARLIDQPVKLTVE